MKHEPRKSKNLADKAKKIVFTKLIQNKFSIYIFFIPVISLEKESSYTNYGENKMIMYLQ
jgi:hypothetical protein